MVHTIDLDLNLFCPTDDTHVPKDSFRNDNDNDDCSYEKEMQTDDSTFGDLSRISNENKELKKSLVAIWSKYNILQTHVKKLIQEKELLERCPKKRKFDETVQQSSWKINPNDEQSLSGVKRVYIRVDPSDKSLVIKDEYQWRKYGQKVPRDNPSPRAYYKCSFAPFCPVKKKVQRSIEDDGVVVVTYEGEHNHKSRMQEAASALANECEISSTSERKMIKSPKLDEILVEQMATYLSRP